MFSNWPICGCFPTLGREPIFFTLFLQIFLDALFFFFFAQPPFLLYLPKFFLMSFFFAQPPFFLHFISPKKFLPPLKIFSPPPLFCRPFFYILSIFVFSYNVNFAAPIALPTCYATVAVSIVPNTYLYTIYYAISKNKLNIVYNANKSSTDYSIMVLRENKWTLELISSFSRPGLVKFNKIYIEKVN